MRAPSADQLADIEALKQLKARYFRCMDTKAWDEMAQVFARDGFVRFGPAEGDVWHGRDTIIRELQGALREATTVHHGHMPEIEITGPGQARGVWAMFDYVELPGLVLRGYGHYTERYVLEDGAWRIAECTLTRLRVDTEARPGPDARTGEDG